MSGQPAAAASLQAARELVGPGTVVLVRHGNTNKPAEGSLETLVERDLPRTLSDKGRQQCAAARSAFWGALRPRVRMALHSKAGRCRETALALCGGEWPAGVPLVSVDELYGCQHAPDVEVVFDKTGYCSLATFREAGGDPALADWQHRALSACVAAAPGRLSESGDVLSVFCHALYTQALARAFAAALGLPAGAVAVQLDPVNLAEAEGFAVSAAGGVQHLTHAATAPA
eukprot:TRINITY_DN50963_c0_g1_i1.p1 TRINITY_DN50963_c0_g1~~TRINITY_DN50963_c0_g1_i1.p1  ORF type:complete len:261 (+),score=90.18 TRINITY_DN50963_c0_g1_i1:95-784(+)